MFKLKAFKYRLIKKYLNGMGNHSWREAQSSSYQINGFYAKKLSLAWINWETNQQEERLKSKEKVRNANSEIRGVK
jgi:hypothetical protein